ncbi:hypothetical protein GCM10010270_77910 [Streptomyces violaceus]|nr:hypothetical protein GCM10010270_77910 [Streptomyces janthinus]
MQSAKAATRNAAYRDMSTMRAMLESPPGADDRIPGSETYEVVGAMPGGPGRRGTIGP